MNEWIQVVIALVAGFLGGGLLTGVGNLLKGRSGAARDFVEAAACQMEQYRKQIAELTAELAELKNRVLDLEKLAGMLDEVIIGAHRLVHQVRALGADPVYIPPERREQEEGKRRKK